MQEFWMSLWTFTWYVSLVIFSLLSVLIIIFGGYDLAALLKSLHTRHVEGLEAHEEVREPFIPPAPPAP